MPTATPVREIEISYKDGTTSRTVTPSYPWVYREWLVVLDIEERKHYHPLANVTSWEEVVSPD